MDNDNGQGQGKGKDKDKDKDKMDGDKNELDVKIETLKKKKKKQLTDAEKKELGELKQQVQAQNIEKLKQKLGVLDEPTMVHFISGSKKLKEPAVYHSKWQTVGACSLSDRYRLHV